MSTLHCENVTFPSSDRKHTSSAVIYTCPDVPVRAVIQLSHGMCEYVRRYAPMADFYAAHGIALAGNDHLGHGDTAQAGEHGHYGEKDGRFHLLDDLHTMNSLLHERFPGLPIILYGHSMGSFYARWDAEKWPESITALIISGTAGPSVMNAIGQRLAALIAAVKGNDAVSPLMVNLNFGSYCKRIPDAASPNAWLRSYGIMTPTNSAPSRSPRAPTGRCWPPSTTSAAKAGLRESPRTCPSCSSPVTLTP